MERGGTDEWTEHQDNNRVWNYSREISLLGVSKIYKRSEAVMPACSTSY